MQIGLFFGSFNPIHTGHLIIANHILAHTDLDKIWFVLSPQNPLKRSNSLLNEFDRLHLVELAIADNTKFRASNIEFHLPKPSYTINTLAYLEEKFPHEQFTIIMGSDSYQNIPRWKNYEQILKEYQILVYQRPGCSVLEHPDNVHLLEAPFLEISATHIRKELQAGRSVRYLLPEQVREYIQQNKYYL